MANKQIDEFDLEAEREFNAIFTMRTNGSGPFVSGKKIIKMRKMYEKGDIKQDNRVKGRYLVK